MKLNELISLLTITTAEGAKKALSNAGQLSEQLTKAQAYRTYGRTNVDRWLTEGLLHITNKKIDRINLECVAQSSNRITYLPVAERKGATTPAAL